MMLSKILLNAYGQAIDLMKTPVYVDGIRQTQDVLVRYNCRINTKGRGALWVTTGATK